MRVLVLICALAVQTHSQTAYSATYAPSSEYTYTGSCLLPIQIPATALSDPVNPYKSIALTTVTTGWTPRLVQIEETAPFTSTSTRITALSASIGTLQSPSYYVGPLVLMKPAPNFIGDDAAGQAAQLTSHTLYLTVSATNKNPGPLALATGSLTIKICGVVLRADLGPIGSLPAAPILPTVGTIVAGICQPNSTGFHLVGKTLLSNEVQANCILP